MDPFVTALGNGDLEGMLARLADNVVLVADGGKKPGALLQPLHGATPVARAMLHALRKHGVGPVDIRRAIVNGLPGFVRYGEGRAQAVLAFSVVGDRITSVFVISNPEKLRHLNAPSDNPPTEGTA